MKKLITKEILEKTAELARFDLEKEEEEKLLVDLEKILGHFEELKGLDSENVEPMAGHAYRQAPHNAGQAGGTEEKNVFRNDESARRSERERQNIAAAFPENRENFLKVPPVFE
ncbi:MAG: Asp-tRNA(Asn)/Glu-tRNA(Gln) amidotransferase subunit GatC [Parcubacteria group bacterium]|nr:Asp-tRNA(Asn)/Glu-tRNA(Gln) amidotransferase subunit GatC [Parcubacteria group bacterium]